MLLTGRYAVDFSKQPEELQRRGSLVFGCRSFYIVCKLVSAAGQRLTVKTAWELYIHLLKAADVVLANAGYHPA